ncbi:hypothetical protein PMSD_14305 [Paenibacillus macquariensis subsp. defensor]|nr:hypothetical protein PMSD_14305 [Paenibacillus macquariensis subsp. defensor]
MTTFPRAKKYVGMFMALLMVCQLTLNVQSPKAYASSSLKASDWADSNRNYRMKLSFDNIASNENLLNFSVPVRLDTSKIDYAVTGPTDLQFFDEDQRTVLPYEVEKWDAQGESIVWVKVPQIDAKSSTDHMWLYYGGSSRAVNNAKQVWDPSYLLVYHFGERIEDYYTKPSAVKQFQDSTANNNTGLRQSVGATESGTSYSLEGQDPKYNRIGKYYESHRGGIRSTNGNVGDGEKQITVGGWVRANEYELKQNYYVISRARSGDDANEAFSITINGGKWKANVYTNSADSAVNGYASTGEMNAGTVDANWTYLSLTYDSTKASNNLKLYRDGVEVASATREGAIIKTSGAASPLTIGKASDAGMTGGAFHGGVDEVRVSRTARSADWIQAEYASMTDSFLLYGTKESQNSELIMTLLQPKDGEVYYSPELSFTGILNKPSKVTYTLNGGQSVETDTDASGLIQVNLTGLKSGVQQLNVKAVSLSDTNETTEKTVNFSIDGSALSPMVTPSGPSGTLTQQSNAVPLQVQVNDPTGDPVDVEFYEKDIKLTKDFSSKISTDVAYDRTNSMTAPANANITSETPLSSTGYDQIAAEDNEYFNSRSLSNYPYQRFDLTVSEDLKGINKLEVVWKGHTNEKMMMYAWNNTNSRWELIGSGNGSDDQKDFKIKGTLNTATMINSTTKVAKLYVASTQRDISKPAKIPNRSDYDFSFVWMTDTQYQSESFPHIFDKETQWIADHKDELGIKYVAHTGDIVNTATAQFQWVNADHSMKILDDANVPYGVIQGNHDVNAYYFDYFGQSRFANKPYYAGNTNNNKNHYDLISANGADFIIMYLGWGYSQSDMDWANGILQQYKDRKAILAVHEYLYYDSGNYGTDDVVDAVDLMNKVVAPNSNVFMVLCGHHQAAIYNVKRIGGKVVYENLHDYQDVALGGAASFRMMYFNMKDQELYMVPYSAVTNENTGYFQSKFEAYTIPLNPRQGDIELATDYIGVQGSQINSLGKVPAVDGRAEFVWNNRQVGQPYTWYAQASDSINTTKSEESSFTIQARVIESLRLKGLAPMSVGEQVHSVVEAVYSDGSITLDVPNMVFTSSQPEIAEVDTAGVVTANQDGETLITVNSGRLSASYKLLVTSDVIAQPDMQSIRLDNLNNVKVGETLQAVVTAQYTDQTEQTLLGPGIPAVEGITLLSADPTVVSVDVGSGVLTALKEGATVVSATYGVFQSTVQLMVTADAGTEQPKPVLQSLQIYGANKLNVNDGTQLKLSAQYSDGSQQMVSEDVQYSSSNAAVVTVDATGVVKALSKGKASITAYFGTLMASFDIEVINREGNGSNSGGGGNGGNGNSGAVVTPNVPSQPSQNQESIQVVKPKDLKPGSSPKSVSVTIPDSKTEVKIPYSLADISAELIDVVFPWGTVQVARSELEEVGKGMSKEQQSKAQLTISYHPITDDLDAALKSQGAAAIRLMSPMVSILWASSEGSNQIVQGRKIQISAPVKENMNGKRIGLYNIFDESNMRLTDFDTILKDKQGSYKIVGNGQYMILEYEAKYADLKKHWAETAVIDLTARDLFRDFIDGSLFSESPLQFKPNVTMTRAETAALLARASGLSGSAEPSFTDVKKGMWYNKDLSSAAKSGLVQGVNQNTFMPDGNVTREQFAVMLVRAWKLTHKESPVLGTTKYKDNKSISSWAQASVEQATALHLLKGQANGNFAPKGLVTRAEAAQAIHNLLESL